MYVRVFDKNRKAYFKSIVYATVGTGWFLQYIVLNPLTKTFDLADYLDKSHTPAKPLIEMIQPEHSDFITYKGSAMLKYKNYCNENGIEVTDIKQMAGYPEVCENHVFLADIFTKKSVPMNAYEIPIRELKDASNWNYILTQSDANDFMEKFAGFHDSTLEAINYIESNDSTSATATFDNSGWFGVVELSFEGIQMMKILPAGENYSREILDASLIVENESVFWADSYMEKPDISYDGSIITALSLKWRKV